MKTKGEGVMCGICFRCHNDKEFEKLEAENDELRDEIRRLRVSESTLDNIIEIEEVENKELKARWEKLKVLFSEMEDAECEAESAEIFTEMKKSLESGGEVPTILGKKCDCVCHKMHDLEPKPKKELEKEGKA